MSLPADYARRGAPPGSSRALALLFAPAHRDPLAALYALDAEFNEAAALKSHEVAHRKLLWWADELARLGAGAPRHPLTIVLAAALGPEGAPYLAARLLAARETLAELAVADEAEFKSRLERSQGSIGALAALVLGDSADAGLALGVALGRLEIAESVASDARRGRLRLPLAGLPALVPAALAAGEFPPAVRQAQQRLARLAEEDLRAGGASEAAPLRVLRALARARIARWRKRGYPALPPSPTLAPLADLFIAWRAARRTLLP
jgi:15-cis-phytoene synthase